MLSRRLRPRRHHPRGDVGTRITVSGPLDRSGERRVVAAMWRGVDRGRQVVVDLSGVTYFDSTSLWTLLGVERLAEHQFGCDVDLRGLETAAFALTGVE